MSTNATPPLTKFKNSGDFRQAILAVFEKNEDAAKRAMSAQTHLDIFGTAQAAPLTDPGVSPNVDGPTITVRAQQSHALDKWIRDSANYKTQIKQDKEFKTDLLSVCPVEAKDAMMHPDHGHLNLTGKTY
jgi:hypothetical protein